MNWLRRTPGTDDHYDHALYPGTVAVQYYQSFTYSAGVMTPYTWSLDSGQLPPGLVPISGKT